jgi:hypothetical protein
MSILNVFMRTYFDHILFSSDHFLFVLNVIFSIYIIVHFCLFYIQFASFYVQFARKNILSHIRPHSLCLSVFSDVRSVFTA